MGVYAISRNDDVAVVYIKNPPHVWGTAYETFAAVAEAGVDVNMIIQTASAGAGAVDIIFAIDRENAEETRAILEKLFAEYKDTEIRIDEKVAKIMVMGDEMQGKPGVAASVFRCLWNSEIHIINISASEIGISMLVNADEAEAAMECLNRDFCV